MKTSSEDPTAPGSHTHAPAQADAAPETAAQTPTDAMKDLRPRLAELLEYANYFISAKLDAYRALLRKAGLLAGIAVIGLLGFAAFVVTAVVLLCRGIAGAFAAAMGGRVWAGELLAAVLMLAVLAGGIWFGWRKLTRSSREGMVRKYAQRQKQQRERFGTDIRERAQNPARHGNE